MSSVTMYRPVNCCIYCGSTERLSDEHVVPFSLAGRSVLPSASCAECAKVTSAFEGRCAAVNYASFRLRENLPTRRPKERPTHAAMTSPPEDGGEIFMVPKAGVIATLPLFQLNPPGFFENPPRREIGWVGSELGIKTDSPRDWSHSRRLRARRLSVHQHFDVDSHARLLAKVAHCIAVGHLGMNGFEPWLPPLILGTDPFLSHLVGGISHSEEACHVLHEVKYDVVPHGAEFLVQVTLRLFAQFGGPHHLVIAGRTTQAMLDGRKPYEIAPAQ